MGCENMGTPTAAGHECVGRAGAVGGCAGAGLGLRGVSLGAGPGLRGVSVGAVPGLQGVSIGAGLGLGCTLFPSLWHKHGVDRCSPLPLSFCRTLCPGLSSG